MTDPRQQETPTLTANRRRRLGVAALLVGVVGCGIYAWQRLADRFERQEALRVAEGKDFSKAEPLLRRVSQRQPGDAAPAKALALGYLNANRLAEAEACFALWCAARPDDAEPYRERIRLWVRWSRLRNAVEDARRVLELDPNDRALHQQLCRWLLIVGRFEEAEQECQRLLRSAPNDPWVLLVQALVHQRRGRAGAAAAIVDRLVVEYPDFAEAFVLRATLHVEADQPEQAIPWLRRAAAIPGPHRREALYELSLALARTGQKMEAERVMAEARVLQEQAHLGEMVRGPQAERRDRANVQVRLAEEMFNAGQSEDAVRVLQRVLKQDPSFAPARQLLAAYQKKQGQPKGVEPERRPGPTP